MHLKFGFLNTFIKRIAMQQKNAMVAWSKK